MVSTSGFRSNAPANARWPVAGVEGTMRREDCLELLNRIPVAEHAQVNLILHNRMLLTIDVIIRMEPAYLVFRGREGGSTDEGRGFFVPYEEISYVRLERVVKISEIRRMFGETGVVDEEDVFGVNAVASDKLRAEPKSAGVDTQTPPPGASPLASQDPAAIAKQNLLDRIRAARANVAGTTGKIGGGKG